MSICVGDSLPVGMLTECKDMDSTNGCPLNPVSFDVLEQARGKKLVLFGVPGAFTPTCSIKHLPGFVEKADILKARGVDEIWCMACNDAFVMASWGRKQGADGRIRMVADGSAEYAKALGLDRDLTANGMGIRCHRFAMIIDDGNVKYLGVEASGKFEVSSAEAILAQL